MWLDSLHWALLHVKMNISLTDLKGICLQSKVFPVWSLSPPLIIISETIADISHRSDVWQVQKVKSNSVQRILRGAPIAHRLLQATCTRLWKRTETTSNYLVILWCNFMCYLLTNSPWTRYIHVQATRERLWFTYHHYMPIKIAWVCILSAKYSKLNSY